MDSEPHSGQVSLKYFKIQVTLTTRRPQQALGWDQLVGFLGETLGERAPSRRGLFHVDAPAEKEVLEDDPKFVRRPLNLSPLGSISPDCPADNEGSAAVARAPEPVPPARLGLRRPPVRPHRWG